MSGSSGGSRDDYPTPPRPGGGAKGGGEGAPNDPCLIVRNGPINSPKQAVLTPLGVNTVLDVGVDQPGVLPILVVRHGGQVAGSLTFRGYLEVIDCILNRGTQYRAIITKIAGGVYEVRVEPV